MSIFNRAKTTPLTVCHKSNQHLYDLFIKNAVNTNSADEEPASVRHSVIVSGQKLSMSLHNTVSLQDPDIKLYGHIPLSINGVYIPTEINLHVEKNSTESEQQSWAALQDYGNEETFAALEVHLFLSDKRIEMLKQALNIARIENALPNINLRFLLRDNPDSFWVNGIWIEALCIYGSATLKKNLLYTRGY